MIDYLFRNHTTGKELKRTLKRKIADKRLKDFDFQKEMDIPEGYEFVRPVNYKVSKRERKAK